MAERDIEERETEDEIPEVEKGRGGTLKMIVIGFGIFVILVAAQVVVPPLNDLLYGDPDEEAVEELAEGDVLEGEEAFPLEEPIDFSAPASLFTRLLKSA